MRTTFLSGWVLLLLFFSCNTEQKEVASEDSSQQAEPIPEEAEPMANKEFDWEDVPVTSEDIGDFPYFTLPEGMVIGEGYGEKDLDFSKLELFIKNGFVAAEGRVNVVSIQKDSKNGVADWSQHKFDSHFDQYMESIGAKLVFKGEIPSEQLEALNESDKNNVHTYVVGDVYNNPIRVYALNHSDQKVFIQVSSSSAAADVGVVKLVE